MDRLFLTSGTSNVLTQSTDKAEAITLFKLLLTCIVLPICLLGLADNALLIWVWNHSKRRNPMVLLFQILGFMDIFYLLIKLFTAAQQIAQGKVHVDTVHLNTAAYLSQTLSLHCTVIIAIIRWLVLARPQAVKNLSRRKLLVACAAVGGWCLFLGALLLAIILMLPPKSVAFATALNAMQVVAFVIPTLILVGFGICLIRITFQHEHKFSVRIHKQCIGLTMAVFCIAISALLAFTGGMLAFMWGSIVPDRSSEGCSWHCFVATYLVGNILFVLNSSTNFFFYLIFVSKY